VVAEPVTEKELPTTEVEDVSTPESVEQPEAEIDDVPEDAVSAFLKEQKILDGTSDGDGEGTKADDAGPDLSKLTPQQILDLGKQQGKSETLTEAQVASARYQNQQRVEGARNVLAQSRQTLTNLLTQVGNDANTVIQASQLQDQLHGAWNLVYQADIAAAGERAKEEFNSFVQATAATVLGTKGKTLTQSWNDLPDADKSSAKFFELYAEKAREGYLSPSDVEKKVSTAVRDFIKKMPKEARDAIGFNSSTTKTGTSSSGGTNLSYQQLLKNPKLIDGLTGEQWDAIVAKG
jgi:hypothetical protein